MTAAAVPARTSLPAPVDRDAAPIEILERVIVTGDLAQLTPQERVALYARTCESLGLNPLTRPFEYINLSGKLTFYARKDATEQLRRNYRVSIDSLRRELDPELGLLTYIAEGHTPDGRRDQASGSVTIKGLAGEALANASMKAETKAKRRLTLSLVGLGFLDEIEIEGGDRVEVDPETGEIRGKTQQRPPTLLAAVTAQRERLDAPATPTATVVEPADPSVGEGERDGSPETVAVPAGASEPVPPSAPAEGPACGWKLGRGRGQSSLDCTFEEMHGGKHSWDAIATSEGGRVIRPD